MRNQKLELTWFNKDMALIPKDRENARYDYEWVDPQDPRYCETHTLVMDEYIRGEQAEKEDSKQYSSLADLVPATDNLMILGESGDVLEALTRVPELRGKYAGQVKLVYIDPPFNTGETFDHYDDNLEHSVWLTMMRDRLIHLRGLLSEDGSIWVHLDDSENHRMRILLDEVFGAGNFVAEIHWQQTSSPQSTKASFIGRADDVILVYRKSALTNLNRLPRKASMDARYGNPDNDPLGPWANDPRSAPHSTNAKGYQVAAFYSIEHPITGEIMWPPANGQWRFKRETVKAGLSEYGFYEEVDPDLEERSRRMNGVAVEKLNPEIKDFRIALDKKEESKQKALARIAQDNWPQWFITKDSMGRKGYLPELGATPNTWWTKDEVGHTRESNSEIVALFPDENPFDTPKPERLMERIIRIATNPGDLVLDCFAGSATTAAVAQKMGRRWVTCELQTKVFETFSKPRLEKVVKNLDDGGITYTKSREAKTGVELPTKHDPNEIFKLSRMLTDLSKVASLSDTDKAAIKQVQKLIATKPSTVQNWRGGGGFQVAHLSPTCFSYDPDLEAVTLTEAGTGETLKNAVAAHLGFTLTPESPFFDGVLGAQRLVVLETFATASDVDELVSHLDEGETLVLCATGLDTGVRKHLLKTRRGSVAKHIPDDLFTVSVRMRDEPSVDPDEVEENVTYSQKVK